jgi:hypothetical protein
MINQKTFCITALLVLGGFLYWFQQGATRSTPKEKKQSLKESEARKERERQEIEALAGQALASQPEFASDVLLRIVESNKIADVRQRVEILEQAFRLASQVRSANKKVALPGSASDVRSGFLANALLFLNFDKLSLQCRAVKAALSIDKQKAKELFSEISKPKPELLTCEEGLIDDVSVYYNLATSIAQSAFNEREIRQGENVRLVQQLIDGISSPSQLHPAISMLLALEVSSEQYGSLINSFSAVLDKVSGDDRSFSVPWGLSPSLIESAVMKCKKNNVSSGKLLAAYRGYLVRHFSATRCADKIPNLKSIETSAVKYFNDRLRLASFSGERDFPSISDDEVLPQKIEGAVKYIPYWTTSKSKGLLTRVQQLNFKGNGKKYSSEEKLEAEWQQKLSELLTDLTNWKSDDEKTEEDYFHQRSMLLFKLIDISPMGATRQKILTEFISFVGHSEVQKSSPVEWFVHAERLIRLARSQGGEDGKTLFAALKNTNNPTLYLYAQLEELLPLTKN